MQTLLSETQNTPNVNTLVESIDVLAGMSLGIDLLAAQAGVPNALLRETLSGQRPADPDDLGRCLVVLGRAGS